MGEPRNAKSYIQVESRLSAAELIAIAQQVAAQVQGTFGPKSTRGQIDLKRQDPTSATFVIRNAHMAGITFAVNIIPEGEHRRFLRTEILGYRSKQDTMLGIPIGPKAIVMYHYYETFMFDVGVAVADSDSTARVRMDEDDE